jgi:hypothetical protein
MSNRSILTAIAAVGVLAGCFSSTAVAKPVAWKDLVGKKVCWTFPTAPPNCANGADTYYAGGKYNSYCFGNVTCQGHHCVGDNGTFERQMEKLPDGTFKGTVVSNGVTYEGTGHYCQ